MANTLIKVIHQKKKQKCDQAEMTKYMQSFSWSHS